MTKFGVAVGVPAIIASAVLGYRAFEKHSEKLFIAGSVGMLLSIPYHLVFVRPNHQELKKCSKNIDQGSYLTKGEENQIEQKLKEWDNRVKVRTLIIGASAILFVLAELRASGKLK